MKKCVIVILILLVFSCATDNFIYPGLIGARFIEKDFVMPEDQSECEESEGACNRGYIEFVDSDDIKIQFPGSDTIDKYKYVIENKLITVDNKYRFEFSVGFIEITDLSTDTVYILE